MGFTPAAPIAPFWGWTQFTPALPEFYWDVYSAEERIKKICMELHKLCEYANMLGDNINIDHELITELQVAFQNFIDGRYDSYYKNLINTWIIKNMPSIMAKATHMTFFNLTDDGYFCAYVPEKWAFVFDTILNYNDINYGSLTITY